MAWFPGWEAVESTHWWSNIYFALSIVALIMLGVFEVISHRYSEREGDLAAEQLAKAQQRYDEEIARLHLASSEAIERAAQLEREAAAANERAAILEKETAVLRERTTLLARDVGLRNLNGERFLEVLGISPKGEVEILYGAEDIDSILLALSLRVLLEKAGWSIVKYDAVPLATLLHSGRGIVPKNIKIEVRDILHEEMPIMWAEMADGKTQPRTLYAVLAGAIMVGLGGVRSLQAQPDPLLPPDRARITVYPR